MDRIGERWIIHYWPGTDIPIPLGGINAGTVISTVVVIVTLLILMRLAVRRLAMVPGRAQVMMELYVSVFDDLVAGSLELETREKNRRFFPLIAALFVFLLLSNFMGFPPTNLVEEPTADINTTLALGTMATLLAAACGVKVKGAKVYFEELLGPMWSQEGAGIGAQIAGKLSSLFFFPLNVVGELSKIVSISFRIFGNIMGGAIILTVVGHLVYQMVLPIGMNFFFVFFQGAIQAFVFTTLTLTYIAVAIK